MDGDNTMTTGNGAANQRHAERLLAEARPMLARRRALLTASTALATTATTGAALQALREWDGPADVRDAAMAIITDLRRATGTP
jgi:hypothetical protein